MNNDNIAVKTKRTPQEKLKRGWKWFLLIPLFVILLLVISFIIPRPYGQHADQHYETTVDENGNEIQTPVTTYGPIEYYDGLGNILPRLIALLLIIPGFPILIIRQIVLGIKVRRE